MQKFQAVRQEQLNIDKRARSEMHVRGFAGAQMACQCVCKNDICEQDVSIALTLPPTRVL